MFIKRVKRSIRNVLKTCLRGRLVKGAKNKFFDHFYLVLKILKIDFQLCQNLGFAKIIFQGLSMLQNFYC